MLPTETAPLPSDPELADTGFDAALRAALRLSSDDQVRLSQVLAALTNARAVPLAAASVQGEDQAQLSLQDWLQDIERYTPRERVVLIDEALEQAGPGDAPALLAARREIFAAQPALAVRLAVEGVASRAPILLLLGVSGMALAIYVVGRGVFHLIF